MANSHRTNVLVTSCLKTPVDPHTKAPVALYERERVLPYASGHVDNRDYEKEMEYDSGSEYGAADLRDFYVSNDEYYRKLEQLKRAHLRTMAELERMYRKKLGLKGAGAPLESTESAGRLQWDRSSSLPAGRMKKSHSAHELRRGSGLSDSSDEDRVANDNRVRDNAVEKGLLLSPKEHIKNMWQDFSLDAFPPRRRRPSSSSLQSLPGAREGAAPRPKAKGQRATRRKAAGEEERRRQWAGEAEGRWVTAPEPFRMTLREAERRRRGVKSRGEVELENAELRRKLEELTECQRRFRASPVPAHVRLPLCGELAARGEERRRRQLAEQQRLAGTHRPFSFLERERLKGEQKEARLRAQADREEEEERGRRPFRARPVPRAVREAAAGEQLKEEQLYRAIKMQMRARELLHSASMPPSMLARRSGERRVPRGGGEPPPPAAAANRPRIAGEVPDFDASYRRFRERLESRREARPATACEPFQLRTASVASRRERAVADVAAGPSRCPYVRTSSPAAPTPRSSLCSSLSGSQERLTAKITDAARKRQEAVRKVLEQRKQAEEEEERRRERQKQRERRLGRVITKRAQANDPRVTLKEACQSKLKEFRNQDQQRRKEYREEMREIQQRVKGRPLLLEQVAQRNAKQAAEKRYADALLGCGLSEGFVSSKAPKSQRQSRESLSMATPSCDTPVKQSGKDYPCATAVNFEQSSDDYPDDYEDYDQDLGGEQPADERKHKKEEENENGDDGLSDGEGEGAHEDEDDSNLDEDSGREDDVVSRRRGSRSSHSRHGSKSRERSQGRPNSPGSLRDGESGGRRGKGESDEED